MCQKGPSPLTEKRIKVMELTKQKWNNKDIVEFNKYLESVKRPEKLDFTI